MVIHLAIHLLGTGTFVKKNMKKKKDFQENKDEDNFSRVQQPSSVGWRSLSVQFTASSPQDTCSPLISSLTHSRLFSSPLEILCGKFWPGTV